MKREENVLFTSLILKWKTLFCLHVLATKTMNEEETFKKVQKNAVGEKIHTVIMRAENHETFFSLSYRGNSDFLNRLYGQIRL